MLSVRACLPEKSVTPSSAMKEREKVFVFRLAQKDREIFFPLFSKFPQTTVPRPLPSMPHSTRGRGGAGWQEGFFFFFFPPPFLPFGSATWPGARHQGPTACFSLPPLSAELLLRKRKRGFLSFFFYSVAAERKGEVPPFSFPFIEKRGPPSLPPPFPYLLFLSPRLVGEERRKRPPYLFMWNFFSFLSSTVPWSRKRRSGLFFLFFHLKEFVGRPSNMPISFPFPPSPFFRPVQRGNGYRGEAPPPLLLPSPSSFTVNLQGKGGEKKISPPSFPFSFLRPEGEGN